MAELITPGLIRLNEFAKALKALNLPSLRQRKLNGILNALTMQIEDGGDSPEVNKLLVEALRAAVIFQVGEDAAKPLIEALARFEQAETLRGEAKIRLRRTE